MCHNRTVLSMDEDSRKKFWMDRAKIKQDETEERTTTALFTLHNSVIWSGVWRSEGDHTARLSISRCGRSTWAPNNVLYQELTGEMTQEMLAGSFALYSKNQKEIRKKKTGILLFLLSVLISCSSFDPTTTSYKAHCY